MGDGCGYADGAWGEVLRGSSDCCPGGRRFGPLSSQPVLFPAVKHLPKFTPGPPAVAQRWPLVAKTWGRWRCGGSTAACCALGGGSGSEVWAGTASGSWKSLSLEPGGASRPSVMCRRPCLAADSAPHTLPAPGAHSCRGRGPPVGPLRLRLALNLSVGGR